MSEAKVWGLLYIDYIYIDYILTDLQDRQWHVPCTLGKTSRCWLDLCFHDKDLAQCMVKQAKEHLWYHEILCLDKTLPNI